jgi:hypothetical protein
MDAPDYITIEAAQAQANARARSQFNTDSLLISKRSHDFASPCGVSVLSYTEIRDELTQKLSEQGPWASTKAREGAKLALQALSNQRSDTITAFEIRGVPNTELLPNGFPVIDHLRAFVADNPGYDCLRHPLDRIRDNRVPSEAEHKNVTVKEIVLGQSSAEDMDQAVEWMYDRKYDTAAQYCGLVLCAADTENVQIVRRDVASDRASLLQAFRNASEPVRVKQHPAGQKGRAIQCPVLFMYGSIGWQLHLRINVQYRYTGDNKHPTVELIFKPGTLPAAAYKRLLAEIGPAVGVGIAEDYREFFAVVESLYKVVECTGGRPFDIRRLSRLAGSNHPRGGIVELVLVWLGGVLPKHWACSVGDGKWGFPFRELPIGLKLYLEGDIQSIARVATVMVMVMTTHTFPDPLLVHRTADMESADLVRYWGRRVVELLSRNPTAWETLEGHDVRHTSRASLIASSGVPSGTDYDILRLCPGWPAITNGGPRYAEQVNEFFRQNYHVLRASDPGMWPGMSSVDLTALTTHHNQPNINEDPRNTEPSQKPMLSVGPMFESDWLDLPFNELTYENIRVESKRQPGDTVRGALGRYVRHDSRRALRMLLYWEEDRCRVQAVIGKDRWVPAVADVRDFLRVQNMLPDRPDDWVDPLGEQQFNAMKTIRVYNHAVRSMEIQEEAARRRMERAARYCDALNRHNAKPNEERVRRNHPLMRCTGVQNNTVMPAGGVRKKRPNKLNLSAKLENLRKLGSFNLTADDVRHRSIREILLARMEGREEVPSQQPITQAGFKPKAKISFAEPPSPAKRKGAPGKGNPPMKRSK